MGKIKDGKIWIFSNIIVFVNVLEILCLYRLDNHFLRVDKLDIFEIYMFHVQIFNQFLLKLIEKKDFYRVKRFSFMNDKKISKSAIDVFPFSLLQPITRLFNKRAR